MSEVKENQAELNMKHFIRQTVVAIDSKTGSLTINPQLLKEYFKNRSEKNDYNEYDGI